MTSDALDVAVVEPPLVFPPLVALPSDVASVTEPSGPPLLASALDESPMLTEASVIEDSADDIVRSELDIDDSEPEVLSCVSSVDVSEVE